MTYFDVKDFNTGSAELDEGLLIKILNNFIGPLDSVRESFGQPVYIRSGYRDTEYNESVGGASRSQHLYKSEGAADVSSTPSGVSPKAGDLDKLLIALVEKSNFRRLAIYNSFIHVDYKNPGDDTYQAIYKVVKGKWILHSRDGEKVKQL